MTDITPPHLSILLAHNTAARRGKACCIQFDSNATADLFTEWLTKTLQCLGLPEFNSVKNNEQAYQEVGEYKTEQNILVRTEAIGDLLRDASVNLMLLNRRNRNNFVVITSIASSNKPRRIAELVDYTYICTASCFKS